MRVALVGFNASQIPESPKDMERRGELELKSMDAERFEALASSNDHQFEVVVCHSSQVVNSIVSNWRRKWPELRFNRAAASEIDTLEKLRHKVDHAY